MNHRPPRKRCEWRQPWQQPWQQPWRTPLPQPAATIVGTVHGGATLLGVAATHAADFWQRWHFGGALFSGTVGGGAIVGAIFRPWCHFGGAVFGGKVGSGAIVCAILGSGANSAVPLFSGTVGGGAIVGAIFRPWCHFGGATIWQIGRRTPERADGFGRLADAPPRNGSKVGAVPWLLPFPDPLLPFSGMVLPHSGALLPLVRPLSAMLLPVVLPFSAVLLPLLLPFSGDGPVATAASANDAQEVYDTCFDRAIKLDPRDSSAWNNKGIALMSLGQQSDALACIKEAKRLRE